MEPVSRDDDPALIDFLGDAQVMGRLRHGPLAPDRARALLASYVDTWRRRGFGVWALYEFDGTGLVGLCGLVERPDLDAVALTCAIAVPYQGRGYGTEAMAAAIRHGFAAGLPQILGVARATNLASQRLMERLGMRCEREDVGASGAPIRVFAIARP